MKGIPAHMRGPMKSDDANDFKNYGMTADEVAKYLERKRRKKPPPAPTLIAAE